MQGSPLPDDLVHIHIKQIILSSPYISPQEKLNTTHHTQKSVLSSTFDTHAEYSWGLKEE